MRGTTGRSGGSPKRCIEGWGFIVVGSAALLSVMVGGVLAGMLGKSTIVSRTRGTG